MSGPRPAFVAIVLGACAIVGALHLAQRDTPSQLELVATELVRVHGGPPVLVLREKTGERRLPIAVTRDQAAIFDALLAGKEKPDVSAQAVAALGGRVTRVGIDDVLERVVQAHIEVGLGSRVVRFEASAAEAVTLALRAHAPIMIDAAVLQQSGISPDDLREVRAREPSRGQPPAPVQSI